MQVTGNHRFGLHPNSLTQNEVFITSTHTHTNYSPVAINTDFYRFEFCWWCHLSTRRKQWLSTTCVLELKSKHDLKSTSSLTIMENSRLPFSRKAELQLKERSTYIEKHTFGFNLHIHVRREASLTGIRRAQHTAPHTDTNWTLWRSCPRFASYTCQLFAFWTLKHIRNARMLGSNLFWR